MIHFSFNQSSIIVHWSAKPDISKTKEIFPLVVFFSWKQNTKQIKREISTLNFPPTFSIRAVSVYAYVRNCLFIKHPKEIFAPAREWRMKMKIIPKWNWNKKQIFTSQIAAASEKRSSSVEDEKLKSCTALNCEKSKIINSAWNSKREKKRKSFNQLGSRAGFNVPRIDKSWTFHKIFFSSVVEFCH